MHERFQRVGYLWAALLTVLVASPWFFPGFLFGTDWPGPRHFTVPTDLSSFTLFEVALRMVSAIASAELATKVLIVGALFAAALGAFRALPAGGFLPRAIAGIIYLVNPLVYGRIHYGQLAVIAGYALLPWLAVALLQLARQPGWQAAAVLAAQLTVLGILDLHLLIPAGVLVLASAVTFGIWRRADRDYVQKLVGNLALASGATLLASSYWLIPLLTGANSEGRAIAGVGAADLAAYQASADPNLGLAPNVLGLYGFWAEDTGRFASMKVFAPLWPVVLLLLLALGTLGVAAVIRQRPAVSFTVGGPWVVALLAAGAVALVLEMGVASPVTEPVVRLLDAVFPPYRGMRDAGKWAALVALVYAQLIPLGAIVVIGWLRDHVKPPAFEPAEALAAGLLLALPLYYGNGLLFGMHGQVQPSTYPSGWYQADQVLVADRDHGRVLFLPWHLYLSLDFVRNLNNVVASPAPSFFSAPVLISSDPEIPGVSPPADADQRAIYRLVQSGGSGDWAGELASRNIKYVVLAREVDWQQYSYLANQPGLIQVADYGSLILYRNLYWRR